MIKIYVNKNSDINTIQKAIDSLIDSSDIATIYIANGIYKEKIKITRPNITLIGESIDGVIITNNDYATKIHEDGLPYNTFRTYTLMVNTSNITIKNLTIANSSNIDYPEIKVGQAVSLAVNGDMVKVDNCKLKSYQDTVYLGPLPENLIFRYNGFLDDDERVIPDNYRVVFTNTYIEGTIDFVFGSAKAYFNNCIFHSLAEGGYVFAPSTYENDFYGFTVNSCHFSSNNSTPSTFIARPWRDYGKVVILNSTYDNHILDEGFNKWDNTSRDKTCRFYEYNSNYSDKHSYTRIHFSKTLSKEDSKLYEYHKFINSN